MNQYNDIVKDHFFYPRNLASVTIKTDAERIEVTSGSAELGEAIKLYIKWDLKKAVIADIKYAVYGNPYLVAALSFWSEKWQGKSLKDSSVLNSQELIDTLTIPKTKYYCAFMVEDIFKEAFTILREKYDR